MKTRDVTKAKKAYDEACAAIELATARHAEALAGKIGYPFEYEDRSAYKTAVQNFERFVIADAEASALAARDEKEFAAAALARALDASDLAAQDPDAVICDRDTLRDAIDQNLAEEERLARELTAVRDRSAALWEGAQSAWSRWADRRRAAGLPAPRRLPTLQPTRDTLQDTSRVIRSALNAESTAVVAGSNAERIHRLRREADELAVGLDAYSRDVAERKERAAKFDRERAKEETKHREREAAEHQAGRERYAAAEAERESAAAAFRERVAR